jgi:4-alpha-glucanotransferase
MPGEEKARLEFIFAVHNHQPVGNFDHVIETAYARAYAPLLAALERHPAVRASLHQTGFLWEWIESRHPEYLESVRVLVQRGQLELVSGGHYEPILPVIPERDRQGQIAKQNRWLRDRFGVRARGAWLAERVWEPQLAESMARAGIEYTVLDDSHFASAGWSSEDLYGHFITEENGHLLRVFPIAKKLRYLLPFAEPEETLEWLRERAGLGTDVVLVHADDGEKFGIWPGTYAHCYEQGWVERFLTALEANADWLRTTTFSESLGHHSPRGRIYLPTSSYAEMMEWALPVQAQASLHAALEKLAHADGDLQRFVRGGFWRNFMARYPEANWMHKRMLQVSRRTAERAARLGDADNGVQRASEHLWRSQVNDPYWHGLFGGLYLPHLRSSVYRELIRAETALEAANGARPAAEAVDLDADGRAEIVLRSADLLAVAKPDAGGAVYELDDRRRGFNVLDLLSRTPEAYHAKLQQLAASSAAGGEERAVSIHERVTTKEPDLARLLVYDPYRRGSCIDHLLPATVTPESFEALPDLAALATRPYGWRLEGGVLHLDCAAPIAGRDGPAELQIARRMRVFGATLEAEYEVRLDAEPQQPAVFAVEFAVNLLAGDAPDRYIIVRGERVPGGLASRGVFAGVGHVDFVDEWGGLRVILESSEPVDVWRMPIETVSMSESGFERVYQGSVLLLLVRRELRPGKPWQGWFRQRIEAA